MLPDFALRHVPCAFVPRVNQRAPLAMSNRTDRMVIDANFSTFWSEDRRWTAKAICGVSPTIPCHISRFYPAYKLADRPPTPVATLQEAQRIGREVGVLYVYMGNVPGEGEDTFCPVCGMLVLKRIGFALKENRLQEGCCPACGAEVDGIWFTS